MNKIPKSFRLSHEAVEGLEILSDRYNMPFTQIIEELIFDRVSVSDQHKNSKRRTRAWIEYQTNPNNLMVFADRKAIFDAGYNLGWVHFQTRHRKENLMTEPPPAAEE